MTPEEAQGIVKDRRPESGWASDFPAEGDVLASKYARFFAANATEPWFGPWLIMNDDLVVGTLGFKSEPVVDVLEVGYSVVPSAQGCGVATKALSLLLQRISGRGFAIIAETASWNTPSQSVLRRLQFSEIDERHDANDGDLIIWHRHAD
jgi:RimJ/RimL family protein N-acetyltransferase